MIKLPPGSLVAADASGAGSLGALDVRAMADRLERLNEDLLDLLDGPLAGFDSRVGGDLARALVADHWRGPRSTKQSGMWSRDSVEPFLSYHPSGSVDSEVILGCQLNACVVGATMVVVGVVIDPSAQRLALVCGRAGLARPFALALGLAALVPVRSGPGAAKPPTVGGPLAGVADLDEYTGWLRGLLESASNTDLLAALGLLSRLPEERGAGLVVLVDRLRERGELAAVSGLPITANTQTALGFVPSDSGARGNVINKTIEWWSAAFGRLAGEFDVAEVPDYDDRVGELSGKQAGDLAGWLQGREVRAVRALVDPGRLVLDPAVNADVSLLALLYVPVDQWTREHILAVCNKPTPGYVPDVETRKDNFLKALSQAVFRSTTSPPPAAESTWRPCDQLFSHPDFQFTDTAVDGLLIGLWSGVLRPADLVDPAERMGAPYDRWVFAEKISTDSMPAADVADALARVLTRGDVSRQTRTVEAPEMACPGVSPADVARGLLGVYGFLLTTRNQGVGHRMILEWTVAHLREPGRAPELAGCDEFRHLVFLQSLMANVGWLLTMGLPADYLARDRPAPGRPEVLALARQVPTVLESPGLLRWLYPLARVNCDFILRTTLACVAVRMADDLEVGLCAPVDHAPARLLAVPPGTTLATENNPRMVLTGPAGLPGVYRAVIQAGQDDDVDLRELGKSEFIGLVTEFGLAEQIARGDWPVNNEDLAWQMHWLNKLRVSESEAAAALIGWLDVSEPAVSAADLLRSLFVPHTSVMRLGSFGVGSLVDEVFRFVDPVAALGLLRDGFGALVAHWQPAEPVQPEDHPELPALLRQLDNLEAADVDVLTFNFGDRVCHLLARTNFEAVVGGRGGYLKAVDDIMTSQFMVTGRFLRDLLSGPRAWSWGASEARDRLAGWLDRLAGSVATDCPGVDLGRVLGRQWGSNYRLSLAANWGGLSLTERVRWVEFLVAVHSNSDCDAVLDLVPGEVDRASCIWQLRRQGEPGRAAALLRRAGLGRTAVGGWPTLEHPERETELDLMLSALANLTEHPWRRPLHPVLFRQIACNLPVAPGFQDLDQAVDDANSLATLGSALVRLDVAGFTPAELRALDGPLYRLPWMTGGARMLAESDHCHVFCSRGSVDLVATRPGGPLVIRGGVEPVDLASAGDLFVKLSGTSRIFAPFRFNPLGPVNQGQLVAMALLSCQKLADVIRILAEVGRADRVVAPGGPVGDFQRCLAMARGADGMVRLRDLPWWAGSAALAGVHTTDIRLAHPNANKSIATATTELTSWLAVQHNPVIRSNTPGYLDTSLELIVGRLTDRPAGLLDDAAHTIGGTVRDEGYFWPVPYLWVTADLRRTYDNDDDGTLFDGDFEEQRDRDADPPAEEDTTGDSDGESDDASEDADEYYPAGDHDEDEDEGGESSIPVDLTQSPAEEEYAEWQDVLETGAAAGEDGEADEADEADDGEYDEYELGSNGTADAYLRSSRFAHDEGIGNSCRCVQILPSMMLSAFFLDDIDAGRFRRATFDVFGVNRAPAAGRPESGDGRAEMADGGPGADGGQADGGPEVGDGPAEMVAEVGDGQAEMVEEERRVAIAQMVVDAASGRRPSKQVVADVTRASLRSTPVVHALQAMLTVLATFVRLAGGPVQLRALRGDEVTRLGVSLWSWPVAPASPARLALDGGASTGPVYEEPAACPVCQEPTDSEHGAKMVPCCVQGHLVCEGCLVGWLAAVDPAGLRCPVAGCGSILVCGRADPGRVLAVRLAQGWLRWQPDRAQTVRRWVDEGAVGGLRDADGDRVAAALDEGMLCPGNCGARIVREGGCQHVKCRCGYEVCWGCRGAYHGASYGCVGGVADLDRTAMVTALTSLLAEEATENDPVSFIDRATQDDSTNYHRLIFSGGLARGVCRLEDRLVREHHSATNILACTMLVADRLTDPATLRSLVVGEGWTRALRELTKYIRGDSLLSYVNIS